MSLFKLDIYLILFLFDRCFVFVNVVGQTF